MSINPNDELGTCPKCGSLHTRFCPDRNDFLPECLDCGYRPKFSFTQHDPAVRYWRDVREWGKGENK